jgi:hypothetical protein
MLIAVARKVEGVKAVKTDLEVTQQKPGVKPQQKPRVEARGKPQLRAQHRVKPREVEFQGTGR